MNSYEKLLIILTIFVFVIFVGFGTVKIQEVFDGGETLRLTQNSEFVVENVRADSTGWEYTFRNLQSTPKITTLQVEMDQPVGYAVGDTLHLLNYKDKY